MTNADIAVRLRQLVLELHEAKRQYADLYERNQELAKLALETLDMLQTLMALHEKNP